MDNRYVNIIYLGLFTLLGVIFAKTVDLLWEFTELPVIDVIPNQLPLGIVIGVVIALVVTLILYRNRQAYSYTREVVLELQQVAWPSWKETQKSTAIVIGFAIILGAFLFGIDKFWSLLTNYILVS